MKCLEALSRWLTSEVGWWFCMGLNVMAWAILFWVALFTDI